MRPWRLRAALAGGLVISTWGVVKRTEEDAAGCAVLERLDGRHCYGLEADPAAGSLSACSAACCQDTRCEAWQFHPEQGCWRGAPSACFSSASSFSLESRGGRLRPGIEGLPLSSLDQAPPGGFDVTWVGSHSKFNTFEPVEPYASGPDTHQFEGDAGERYLLRRHGPEWWQLDISESCWSMERHPEACCHQAGAAGCWPLPHFRERCCSLGEGERTAGGFVAYFDVFVMVSQDLSHEARLAWHEAFPGTRVDEASFAAARQRWAVGHHEPGPLCPASGSSSPEGLHAVDSETALWPLVVMFAVRGVQLSGTFVNVGAGTCAPPDPLYQLLHSAEGGGFAGLAVDANLRDLQECARNMRNASGLVVPVHAAVEPLTAVEKLRPHLARLFRRQGVPPEAGQPWPLDLLVVDIDACDCLVAEELMRLVKPKVLVLEIAFHIPPPFRFSAQHDAERAAAWLAEYDVARFNPASGCSLSYALHALRPHGLQLLRLTQQDAIFVHEELAPVVEPGLRVRLPQDEFACYRRSSLWMQMPVHYVREWFFAEHPATQLGNIWSNLSRVNRELGRPGAPFTLDY